MNKLIGVAALAVAPLIFTACGDPPVEATKQASVRKVVEYRDRTPAACLEALEVAGEIFDVTADGFYAASDGFAAAAEFDVAGIRTARRRIQDTTADITALTPDWQTARDECKAAR